MPTRPSASLARRRALITMLLAALGVAWLAGGVATAQSPTLERYWSDAYRFGLSYPPDAKVVFQKDPAAAEEKVLSVTARSGGAVCLVYAVADAAAQNISPDDEPTLKLMVDSISAKMLEEQFDPKNKGRVEKIETVRIGGRLARFYETVFVKQTGPVRGWNWLTLVPGHFFSLACAAPEADFAKPAAQTFMKTIRDGLRFKK